MDETDTDRTAALLADAHRTGTRLARLPAGLRPPDRDAASAIERAADLMSNGAFVAGDVRADWRAIDLAGLEARLLVDGVEIVRQVGGHATKDPLIPAIALANYLRTRGGIAAGQVVTTGTYTGLNYAKPGSTVRAVFTGFGAAEVTLSR